MNIKKAIMILLPFTLLPLVWAHGEAFATLREKYPFAKEIKMIDTYDSYGLCMIIYEPNWSSSAVLYNSALKTITEFTIDEMSVYSAKIIKTENNTILEIIGQTHMGNGSVYLFTFENKLLFRHYALDMHYDDMEYSEFCKIERFKTIPYRIGEVFSRIFKDNILKIDYSQFDTGRIRMYGTVLYISELDGIIAVLAQLDVERIYQYNSPSHRYELIKKTGELYENKKLSKEHDKRFYAIIAHMKPNSFPQQTHFIGVLLPEDITLTLEDCRRYMNKAYGCKSGHGTPIHVTLVPPFRLQEDYATADLIRAVETEVLPKGLGFTAHIDNFDAFGDRTLFANVVAGEAWTRLRDETVKAILNACPGCTKKDRRPFQPHATVSNRDIPTGIMIKALQVMNELNLEEDFSVDNITVFERKGNRWEAAVTVELSVPDALPRDC